MTFQRKMWDCCSPMAAFLAAGWDAPGQDRRRDRTFTRRSRREKPLFRVGVETVFVKVSVTDPLNRYVTGLEQEHFKVFEDKVEQTSPTSPSSPPPSASASCSTSAAA